MLWRKAAANFGYENPDLDNQLDHDDDDDDQHEVNRTEHFEPYAVSTPSSGETIEMQTWQHKQTGMSSYDETPLLGDWLVPEEKESRLEIAKDFIRKKFPKVDFSKLGAIGFGK